MSFVSVPTDENDVQRTIVHFIGVLGSDWELADDVVLFVSCLNNADDGELLLCDGGMSGLPTVVPLSVGDCWVSLSSLGIVTPPPSPLLTQPVL